MKKYIKKFSKTYKTNNRWTKSSRRLSDRIGEKERLLSGGRAKALLRESSESSSSSKATEMLLKGIKDLAEFWHLPFVQQKVEDSVTITSF